jgi:hypothetical protein
MLLHFLPRPREFDALGPGFPGPIGNQALRKNAGAAARPVAQERRAADDGRPEQDEGQPAMHTGKAEPQPPGASTFVADNNDFHL